MNEERPKIVEEHGDMCFADIAEECRNRWTALTDAEQEPFLNSAAEDKSRYDAEARVYEASKRNASSGCGGDQPRVDSEEGGLVVDASAGAA